MSEVKNILAFHEIPDLNADKNVKSDLDLRLGMNWG